MPELTNQTIKNHIVILGWSDRIERILLELRSDVHGHSDDVSPILIVSPVADTVVHTDFEKVYMIFGQLNDPEVLKRAHLETAKVLIIPSEQHALATENVDNLFALLAALAINPRLRICAEVGNAIKGKTLRGFQQSILEEGHIEVVSFESVAERLLAQSAITPGITKVYDHMLSYSENSNEIYVTSLGQRWAEQSFKTLAHECFDEGVILLGYERNEELCINPSDREDQLSMGDSIWFLAHRKADGLKVINPT